jgi:hypothetical protein
MFLKTLREEILAMPALAHELIGFVVDAVRDHLRGRPMDRQVPMGIYGEVPIDGKPHDLEAEVKTPWFDVQRVLVPSDIAGYWVIDDVLVDGKSQFPHTGSVPCRTFQENAVGIRVMFTRGILGKKIVVRVRSLVPQTSEPPRTAEFRMTLIGAAPIDNAPVSAINPPQLS